MLGIHFVLYQGSKQARSVHTNTVVLYFFQRWLKNHFVNKMLSCKHAIVNWSMWP